MSASPTLSDWLKTLPLFPLPHHLISRAVLWLTRQRSALTTPVIRWFARTYDVNMSDAVNPDLASYPTFNEFFTRPLNTDARQIANGDDEIASPADGRISAIGDIRDGRVFQAKGQDYSLLTLIGNDQHSATHLANGRFTTIYLSPRDYHRLHMPYAGELRSQIHIPGRLFSVGPHTVRTVPSLFARNERVVAQFETDAGLLVMVLVGAINVAAIETVWHGLVTPPQRKQSSRIEYTGDQRRWLEKGSEMGRFNMGSTVILLLENQVRWRVDMQPGDAVQMGQFMGSLAN